jgi:hypothetical protein
MPRRPLRRTAQEQQEARLDLFRHFVLTAFFLLLLLLLRLALSAAEATHQEVEPREPRHRITDWY